MASHKSEEEPSTPVQCYVSADDLVEIRNDLREIKTALVGNTALGHKGIFARVETVERLLVVFGATLILLGGERIIKLIF